MRPSAWSAVEVAVRDAYGQLLARLAFQWRDIAAAEDALADALCAALEAWPRDGIPQNPKAWLAACARNQLLHRARHQRVLNSPQVEATLHLLANEPRPEEALVDPRLRLLLVCAHPAIDAQVRTPLMLQVVLGLTSATIAEAFLVTPTTMAQRLVRAKQKVRDAGISFEEPDPSEWEERLGAVLECLYAAFGAQGEHTEALAEETLFLTHLLAELLPNAAEVFGLLALLTFSHARRHARHSAEGVFVPLALQNTAQWDRAAIVRAEQVLRHAAAQRKPGPFQLEAAIQSAHCQRLFSGSTPWRSILDLYRILNSFAPTIASQIGQAVAELENGDAHAASALLDHIDATSHDAIADHQPYWVARAHVLLRQKPFEDQRFLTTIDRAITLTRQPEVRAYLASVRKSQSAVEAGLLGAS
jgi:RNA polymerase sigma-70 factor, ECF subfamily